MKEAERRKRRTAVRFWQKHGHKTVIHLFGDDSTTGGYWWAGYSQAITDFVNIYKDQLDKKK